LKLVFLLRDPLLILYFAITLLLSIGVHEASHAFTADWLGDPTARRLGRRTLNPLAHIDPMGAFVLVVSALIGFGVGWGKATPVNPSYLRRGFLKNLPNGPLVGMAIVAIAGPISNLLLAFFGVQVLRGLGDPNNSSELILNGFFKVFVPINVTLAIFNMIPIPPLDGFRVLVGILPTRLAFGLARLEPYGFPVLILLFFMGRSVLAGIFTFFAPPILHALGAF
jgi:Zn-dependent protease